MAGVLLWIVFLAIIGQWKWFAREVAKFYVLVKKYIKEIEEQSE